MKTLRLKSDVPARDFKISAGRTRAIRLECKYDRYLADVFVDGNYVNQELLDKNLAERMPS